ncbi:hypothetical protein E2C01_023562 [Portunus trituberculatus]|uniref:Uncharacterized protein n=1 Tax=Portunus trituberculatus TaxID=210409 RepID=A0A5B7E8B1_PORTR|nr:hypothetical protein [Portunus trituberculatus]
MPRYFFRRTPLLKKYSPGASDVPASIEPIITVTGVLISDLTCGGTKGQSLDDVTYRANSSISHDWHAKPPSIFCDLLTTKKQK